MGRKKQFLTTCIYTAQERLPQNINLWLDPSNSTTLTMNGSNIASIRDLSPNNLVAQNPTSGTTQPTLGILNGRTAINFNGTNLQFLNLGQPTALNFDTLTASHTFFFVVRSGETSGVIFGRGNNDGTRRHQLYHHNSSQIQAIWGHSFVNAGVLYERNITNIICWEVSPTVHKISINGVEVLSQASGSNALIGVDLLIGARRDTGNTGIALPYTGVMGEIIGYRRWLSTAEKSLIYNYLNNKWRKTGKLLVVGASLEEGMYPGLQKLINTTYNVDYTTVDLAVGGETSTDIRNRIDTNLATHATPGAYGIVHAGGNNVSNTRPYSTATSEELNTLKDDIEYIYDALITAGVIPLPCNLSFRTYDGITNYYPEDGSKPYNDNIILPHVVQLNSAFVYPDGTPYLDLYRFVQQNVGNMIDEVHLNATGYANYRQFVVDTVMRRILTGITPTQYLALPLPATPVLGILTTSYTSITANWTMSSETNVVGYAVEHKRTSDSVWTRSGIVTAPTKTLTITGLTDGVSYDVRVKSATAVNSSVFSNVQSTSTIFTDTFTDADNTDIIAHTADTGQTWLAQTGFAPTNHARVVNNALMPRSSQNVYRANVTMPNANYEVEAVLSVLSNTGSVGVTARASATESTFYAWRYQSNSWVLLERVAGVDTTLVIFSQTLTAGQTVTAKIVCNGNTIEGWVDGVLRATVTNSSITAAGSPGLRTPVAVTSTTGIHVLSMTARLM